MTILSTSSVVAIAAFVALTIGCNGAAPGVGSEDPSVVVDRSGNNVIEPGDPGRSRVISPTRGDPPPAASPGAIDPSGSTTDSRSTGTATPSRCGGGYARTVTPSSVPWVEACSAAGHLTYLPSTDNGYVGDAIPFSFQFYGAPQSTIGISSNGILAFASSAGLVEYSNQPLPYASIHNAIFPFWDDLSTRSGGVCLTTIGAIPSRAYVAEWSDTEFCGEDASSTHLTFEVILSESTNTIDVRYNRMEDATGRALGSSATIGIQEGPGTRYDLFSHERAGAVASGDSIRWVPADDAAR